MDDKPDFSLAKIKYMYVKPHVFKILTQPMVQPAMGGVGNLMAEAINKCSLDASF